MSEILLRARKSLADAELDGLLVSCAVEDSFGRHSQNRRYLSGFSGSTGLALLTKERAIIAVDSRYIEQATSECPEFEIWPTPAERQCDWLPKLIAASGTAGGRIGISRDDMNLSEYLAVTEAAESLDGDMRPEIVAAPRLIEQMRLRKTDEEVKSLNKAIEVADLAYEQVAAELRAGETERQVALAIETAIRKHGGDGVSFDTIVASGPNGSMPHASPTDRELEDGDSIVIDMGALVGGYCSDLTRTTVVGDAPNPRFVEIYGIVFEAQKAAIDGVRPGMSGAEADAFARSVIEKAGYGEQFGHGLGHGVGLQVHESPYLGRTSEDVLDEGMVFTIEPGIYIPGWGGVRIEDVVVLEDGRARVLSQARKLGSTGVD